MNKCLFNTIQTNATLGEPWVVQTGEKNIKKVGEVVTWDGISELDYWGTEWANMINGTGKDKCITWIEIWGGKGKLLSFGRWSHRMD